MRNRFVWFLIGCIVGAVGLYIALWKGGVLAPYMERARTEARTTAPPSTAPHPSPPNAEPQPAPVPRTTPPSGEADRALPRAAGDIIAPIQNLKVSDVLDTFNQGRPGGRTHDATDIMEPRGTPILAMVDGTIKKLFLSKPGGITIYQFDEAEQYCYYYAHLDRYAEGLQEGQHVTRGTVIGYVGSTGDANQNAPHLHLAINVLGPDKKWWQGTPINPYPILMRVLGQPTAG